jgi:hypothetical protein
MQSVLPQSVKSPGLGPAHVRDSVCVAGMLLEVEISGRILHGCGHPVEDTVRQGSVAFAHSGKEDHRLGRAVNVHGPQPVVVVFGCPVFQEEVFSVESNTPLVALPPLSANAGIQEIPDRLEVEPRVKRIDPVGCLLLCIKPGSIRPLPLHGPGKARKCRLAAGKAENSDTGYECVIHF